jgi:hypothetical protein
VRPILIKLALSLVVFLVTAVQVCAQPLADEYRLKAAFLFTFAKFVAWPPEAFTTVDEPIGICVLGQNPFGSVLEETVRGKVVADRTFDVREISNTQQASGCHILFVSASEGKRFRDSLQELKNKQVLTVGETDESNANGGIIGLSLKDGRIRIPHRTKAAVLRRVCRRPR